MQSKNLLPFSASIKNHYNGTKSRRRRFVVSQCVCTKVGRRHSAAPLELFFFFFFSHYIYSGAGAYMVYNIVVAFIIVDKRNLLIIKML